VAAGGLAVGTHQDREQALDLAEGPGGGPAERAAVSHRAPVIELKFGRCYGAGCGLSADCQQRPRAPPCVTARRLVYRPR
jgi:hypothetical protein